MPLVKIVINADARKQDIHIKRLARLFVVETNIGSDRLQTVRTLGTMIWLGRDRRAAEDDARHLLNAYKGYAYREARSRARDARKQHWGEGDRHWSRVARIIARREGREIGSKTADRYGS